MGSQSSEGILPFSNKNFRTNCKITTACARSKIEVQLAKVNSVLSGCIIALTQQEFNPNRLGQAPIDNF